MALGGGVFVAQNKKLPGAYINFVSAARASATLSDRGVCAFPVQMSWCAEGEVITVTLEDFLYNSQKILGYPYDHEKVDGLREAFKNAQKVLLYRVNSGSTKATCTYCDAKYGGKRGNDIAITITQNGESEETFDVTTYVDDISVDEQKGVANTDDLQDNDFVVWKASVALTETAKTPLTGGANGTSDASVVQKALEALESETFNTLGVVSTDDGLKDLAIAWTKRMRDEVGIKFQTVVFNAKNKPDDKAIINVVSTLKGATDDPRLVYWVTGAEAGCKVNASCTNKLYDGEFEVDVSRSQSALETCIDNGEFVLHKVGDDVRVLTDINSKVTVTSEEGEDFKSNQTIRVIDQIGNDIAVLFNTRFLGVIPNNTAGRISLWNEIVKHHEDLQRLGAIENYVSDDTQVSQGNDKRSVVVSDAVEIVNAMEKLYMTCVVS